jgi:uncharacterized protein (TIGR03118 family)
MSKTYQQTNLVSNDTTIIPAMQPDKNLINPWGIVASKTGPFWVSDNNAGVSTIYDGAGNPQSLVVTIPPPKGSTAAATPTGIVSNSQGGFTVTSGGNSGSAEFIFATEDGTISGWNFGVDQNNAILKVDNSTVGPGAVYKGLALATAPAGNELFATNFRAGTMDVFNSSFQQITPTTSGAFTDPKIPSGFAPFGITNFNGNLLVTFAKQDSAKHDDIPGRGLGFVDLFSPSGALLARVAKRGQLNAPWGMAVAPGNFGKFSNDLLIGDFGDGRINAFKVNASGTKFTFAGQLSGPKNKPITIDGLWGLAFGNGAMAGNTNSLYFTAGPNGETAGLFGVITAAPGK